METFRDKIKYYTIELEDYIAQLKDHTQHGWPTDKDLGFIKGLELTLSDINRLLAKWEK